ncbi:hypothetical protein BH18ACT7_BH18ACT7_24900 [soil metagenome]
MTAPGFLDVPEHTSDAQQLFDDDLDEVGFVMNVSRRWAYQPATIAGLFDLIRTQIGVLDLDVRQRGIVIAACASTLGDSYCALAWGAKLAEAADEPTASGVLRGTDAGLSTPERAMAGWARAVARDPNATTAADVQALRDAGFGDEQIFAITVFVALRLAFSTVNDALGALPDAQFRTLVPAGVIDAITYGRPIDHFAM